MYHNAVAMEQVRARYCKSNRDNSYSFSCYREKETWTTEAFPILAANRIICLVFICAQDIFKAELLMITWLNWETVMLNQAIQMLHLWVAWSTRKNNRSFTILLEITSANLKSSSPLSSHTDPWGQEQGTVNNSAQQTVTTLTFPLKAFLAEETDNCQELRDLLQVHDCSIVQVDDGHRLLVIG